MKCAQCGSELDNFNFFTISLEDEDGAVIEEYKVCSVDCANEFVDANEKASDSDVYYRINEKSRCPAYYDCAFFGNLRLGCEQSQVVGSTGLFQPLGIMVPLCDPGEVGLIRVSASLQQCLKSFAESSDKINKEMLSHTKTMKRLTWALLVFTILNLAILAYQIYRLIYTQ